MFWFLKQIYYNFIKFFKFKTLFLLILMFFFIMLKNKVFATTTISEINCNGTTYYLNTPLTLTNNNDYYYILSNSDVSTFYVVEPTSSSDYMSVWNNLNSSDTSSTNKITLNGYNVNNGNTSSVRIYQASVSNGSVNTFTSTTSSSFDITNLIFITGNNVFIRGVIGSGLNSFTTFTSNDMPLINNERIKLTDNIIMFSKSGNKCFLLYTSDENATFNISRDGVTFTCKNNGSNIPFNIYTRNSSNSFDYVTNTTSYNTGSAERTRIFYNTNNFYYYNTLYNTNLYGFYNYLYIPTSPFIVNATSTIEDWSFNYLDINGAGLNEQFTHYLHFTYPNSNTIYEFDLTPYETIGSNGIMFSIPRSRITEDIVVRDGSTISFSIVSRGVIGGGAVVYNYNLDTYILSITPTEQEEINEDSEKSLLSDIKQGQQETTNAVNNLTNSITDDTVSDDSISFPQLDIPDLTKDGLANIFDAFVLAFCTDTPNDIIIPIPYTNKSITIPYNYTREMLTNYGATTLVNIITMFWWYKIAIIITLDIYDKMDKLQSGDVENVENSNITTNMM